MSTTYRMAFEVERGDKTAEYEAEFTLWPADPGSGPTFACAGGAPSSPASVSTLRVFYVHTECGRTVRDERPELEDLVDPDELVEYAAEQDDEPTDEDRERDPLYDEGLDRARGVT